MGFRLRRGETAEWVRWIDARYAIVAVAHRTGMHLALPGSRVTLCMRTPVGDARVDTTRMCPACRGGAKVAYVMRDTLRHADLSSEVGRVA